MTRKLNHNFGTDPELFIYKNFVNTEFGLIPDIIPPAALIEDMGLPFQIKKDKKVLLSGDTFQWSEDGAAIEMQTSPADTHDTFIAIVRNGINELRKYMENWDLNVAVTPLAHFDPKNYWEGRGPEFRECVIFGCDPDMFPEIYFDLGLEYLKETQQIDVSEHNFRYGGGHFHLQAPKDRPGIFGPIWEFCAILFDFVVGLGNTAFKRDEETLIKEIARLEHYGKPGRIRLQEYDLENKIFGIEYRVMSNNWIGSGNNVIKLLNSMDLCAEIVEKDLVEKFFKQFESKIPDMYAAIVNFDQENAKRIRDSVFDWVLSEKLLERQDLADFIEEV